MSRKALLPLWKSGLLIVVLTGLFACSLLFKSGGLSLDAVKFVDDGSQGLLEVVGLLLALPLFLHGLA